MKTSLLQDYCLALLRASRTWRRLADQAAQGFGLSEATAYPLVFLNRLDEAPRQAALAEAIGIEGPSLVRLLDQLGAAGLLERREDGRDKRAKTLHLTKRGVRITADLSRELEAKRLRIFDGVSAADVAASLRVFQALERAAAEQTSEARPNAAAAE